MRRRLLIVVMGPPGVGKSTLADRLARQLPAVLLNSDDITDPLFGNDRGSAEYLRRRPQLYAALYRLAEVNIALGHSVIIDAPHGDLIRDMPAQTALAARAARAGAQLVVLRCRLDPEVQRQRMTWRGAARDHGKLADWAAFLAADPHGAPLALPHLQLDMAWPIEANVERAIAYIGGGGM
jgi:predicted kinase